MYTIACIFSILNSGSTTPYMAVMTEPSGFAVAHGWYLSGVYTGLSKIEVVWQCYQSPNFVSVFVWRNSVGGDSNFGGERVFGEQFGPSSILAWSP